MKKKPVISRFLGYTFELTIDSRLNNLPDPPFMKEKMRLCEEIIAKAGLPKQITQSK